jgi:copper transport protein
VTFDRFPLRHALPAAALLLLCVVVPAWAHTHLVRAEPAADAVLSEAPTHVRLWFSTAVNGTRDAIEVYGPDGQRVDGRTTQGVPGEASAIETTFDGRLPGRYTVRFRVLAPDGHTVTGSHVFTVESATDPAAPADTGMTLPPPVAPPPVAAERADADRAGFLLGVAGRALHLLALALALGPLAIRLLVLGPVGPDIERRLWAVAAGGAALLLPAAALLLAGQGITLGGSLAQGLSRDTLELLMATRWGTLWQIRFLLALLLVWVCMDALMRVVRVGETAPARRLAAAAILGAGLLGVTSAAGHAATADDRAAAMLADVLHLAATAVWVGGLLAFTLAVFPALRRQPPEARRDALAAWFPRFSTVAAVSVSLLLLTGIYQTWIWVGGLEPLLQTGYGRVLVVKLGLVALVLAAAATNRFVVLPAVLRRTGGDAARAGDALVRMVRAEAVVAGLIILVVGVLTSLPPARAVAEHTSLAASLFEPPLEPPVVRIPHADGSVFDLAEARGDAVLIFFGYTQCPDFCPLTLERWTRVHRSLGDEAGRVRFVFISVDAARDSPADAHRYAVSFHPDFVGLAPEPEIADSIQRGFFVRSMPVPAVAGEDGDATHDHGGDAYEVMHSTRAFLIDPAGRLRGSYPADVQADDIARDLRHLLRR